MFLGALTAQDGPVAPLQLKREMCETDANLRFNILRTLSNTYVRFNEFLNTQDGPVSVCGSGPSFSRTYTKLAGDVIACNGAHDYLIERGVVPRFCMVMDAAPFIGDFITPHDEVLYMVASRCHKKLFKHLKRNKVVVWHCKGDECLDALLEKRRIMEPMIHGGSGAATRALFMAIAMGYKEVHLHGADSSFEEEHHVGKTLVPESVIEVWAGKWFKTTAWMAGQVEDFRDFALQLQKVSGARVIVHGDGLLPEMAKAIGIEVINSTT